MRAFLQHLLFTFFGLLFIAPAKADLFYKGVGHCSISKFPDRYREIAKQRALQSLSTEITVEIRSQTELKVKEIERNIHEEFYAQVKMETQNLLFDLDNCGEGVDGDYYWICYRMLKHTYRENIKKRITSVFIDLAEFQLQCGSNMKREQIRFQNLKKNLVKLCRLGPEVKYCSPKFINSLSAPIDYKPRFKVNYKGSYPSIRIFFNARGCLVPHSKNLITIYNGEKSIRKKTDSLGYLHLSPASLPLHPGQNTLNFHLNNHAGPLVTLTSPEVVLKTNNFQSKDSLNPFSDLFQTKLEQEFRKKGFVTEKYSLKTNRICTLNVKWNQKKIQYGTFFQMQTAQGNLSLGIKLSPGEKYWQYETPVSKGLGSTHKQAEKNLENRLLEHVPEIVSTISKNVLQQIPFELARKEKKGSSHENHK